MKTHIAVLVLAAAGLVAAWPAQADPLNYDVVSLQAEARAEVANDLLVASLYIEQTSSDATKLAADVTRAINQAVRVARDLPAVKIESGSQSTWPVYDAKNRLTGWRTRAELRLESKDFDAAARAIAKMTGDLQLASMTFVLSPDTATTTENRLIDAALKAFRARADIVARSMGATGWRPVQVDINAGGNRPPMPLMRGAKMAMASADMAEQELAGGDSEIVVSVNGSIQWQR